MEWFVAATESLGQLLFAAPPPKTASLVNSVHALLHETDTTPPALEDDLINGAPRSGAGLLNAAADVRRGRVAGRGTQPDRALSELKALVLQGAEHGDCDISLGTFSVSVSGVQYSFNLRKRCSGGADGWWQRRSKLVVDRGADWPLIEIDYSGYFWPPEYAHKRVINFAAASAPKQDDPVHAIRPLPLKGALRVIIPIGVQISQFFFGSLPITLQDEASKDGALLSTLRLLTGKSAYSTYGPYGFYIPEVNQVRLNKAARYYATYSVKQTMDLLFVQKDPDTIAFFDFEYDPERKLSPMGITRRLRENQYHKTLFDKFWNLVLQAPCGMTTADLDAPITHFCTKLLAAGDSLPGTYDVVTVSRNKIEERTNICYGVFGALEGIIANFKWSRIHTLDQNAWEEYKASAQVSEVEYVGPDW